MAELQAAELSSFPARPELESMRVDGFSIVKDALPPEFIDRLREALKDHFRISGRMQYGGKFQLRGLNVRPDVARILLTEPVAAVIRSHAPFGSVLLTGECDLMVNTTSGWHKDITADMKMGPEIFDDAEFGVYKIGIYLQDQHEASRAAFGVRPGSHLRRDGGGAEKRLSTMRGDIVVFDVRLDHCGQPKSLFDRILHRLARRIASALKADPEAWYTRLRALCARLGGRSERLAVFLTFGPDAPATRAYEAAGRHRHGPIPAPLAAEAELALDRLGISMIGQASAAREPNRSA